MNTLATYIVDTLYAYALFPCGWSCPTVVKGYFADDDLGLYQQIFFNELRERGFHRTPWQMIFPLQTAGLVRKMSEPVQGMDEMHV